MANMTTTSHANFIPEVWTSEVQEAFHDNLVMADNVFRLDDETKGGGDTIHTPKVSELSSSDKSASTDITYSSTTEGEFTLSLNQHKYTAFLLEDITKVQSSYNLRSIYTTEIGRSLAQAVDSDLTGLHSGLSNTVTSGSSLADTDVVSALETLDGNNVPISDRTFAVHSEAMADLRAVDKFTQYQNTGSKSIAAGRNNGLIPNVYGVDIEMTNNITETSGTPNQLHNLMFHKEAFALAEQMGTKVEAEYSVDSLGWKVAAHTIYGFAEYRDEAGVDVQLDS